MEYVQVGRIYDEPGVDLQLPESHLAFRLPRNFNGRLRPDGTFKIFSADREISCFVFLHGSKSPLPANWMSAEFTIDGEKLGATGELKHAQSDLVYRSFEGDRVLCYKFEKANRRGAGLHGSAAGFKSEADRLAAFLKSFLSSFHRAGLLCFASGSDACAPARSSHTADAAADGATATAGTSHSARSSAPRALVLLAANPKVWVGLNGYISLSLFRGRRSFCARRRILRDICPTKR